MNTITSPGSNKAMVTGALELHIRLIDLPEGKVVNHRYQRFDVDCGELVFTVELRPRLWNKLINAPNEFTNWIAVIIGRVGKKTPRGFFVDNPEVHVYERKDVKPPDNDS